MNFASFIICMIAGISSGIATGFCGLSTAVIISPVLIAFIGIPSYDAVGIAIASGVLGSAGSSYTYYKNKNINIKNGLVLMIFAVIFTLVGSKIAFLIHTSNERIMEYLPIIITLFIGLRFLLFSNKDKGTGVIHSGNTTKVIVSAIGGIVIGLICGTVGAGGGMAMLIMFTVILGYDLKTAVGTSVFIMTFLSFTGALSHFLISDEFSLSKYLPELAVCTLFTLIGAVFTSLIANKISQRNMKLITGAMLILIGAFTFIGVMLGWSIES